ncbi:hypothetical protein BD410DRAFT_845380 [Rickenella mellea]|uniref:Uncharacterized protein n=1 Tax=Rickenella mellea TaxID=50990 RepID=A0A4Y7PIA8_9AGAM|nr:hypothetical protein BD410DRAFT_845380 [Rickenella mellea]
MATRRETRSAFSAAQGKLCKCMPCSASQTLDPRTNTTVSGRFLSNEEWKTHQREEQLRAQLTAHHTHSKPNTPNALPPAKSTLVATGESQSSINSDDPSSTSETSETAGDCSVGGGLGSKTMGAKKLKSRVTRSTKSLLREQEWLHRGLKLNMDLSHLQFLIRPSNENTRPEGHLSVSPAAEENQEFIDYTAWLLQRRHAVEAIDSHSNQTVENLRNSVLARVYNEEMRLISLKKVTWDQQAKRKAPELENKAVNTSKYLRSPFRDMHLTCAACILMVAALYLICNLSWIECGFALSALRAILPIAMSLVGTITPAVQNVIDSIPIDIRTVVKLCNLSPPVIPYVNCPDCFFCYPLDSSNEYPDRCTFKDTKSSKPCNRALRRKRKINGKEFIYPVRKYLYHNMKEWFGELLCRPGMEEHLDRDVFDRTNSDEGTLGDIWDGDILRTFTGPDGKAFVRSDGSGGRYVFSLSMDGFNPYQNKIGGKKAGVCGIYLIFGHPEFHILALQSIPTVGQFNVLWCPWFATYPLHVK